MLSEKLDPKAKQKFLVLCLPGIGDSLMATPLLRLLKQKFPNSQIDVAVMFEASHYIFLQNPFVNLIYKLSVYPKITLNALRTIWNLRKNHYNVSILAFPAYRREYHIIHWLIGAQKRIAHRFFTGYWSEANFLETDLILVEEDLHNVENNLNLLKPLGILWHELIQKDDIQYDLKLVPEDIEFGKNYIQKLGWQNENIIGLHPGSTNSPAAMLRRWSIERYAQLARNLIKEKNAKILIFCGPEEKNLGEELSQLINDPSNCQLIAGVSFGQALGILNQLKLLICNDNGFGHLAVALHKQIVTLWASTNDAWSLPFSKDLVRLIRPKAFKSWYTYSLKRALPRAAESGMDKISVEEVKASIS